MNILPIKTEQDYERTLQRIQLLWKAEKNTPKGDEFDVLCTLVEVYETKHYPILPPDPISAIQFRLEQMGLSKIEIIKYFGSRLVMDNILSGKQLLTLELAKKLHKGLGIPAEVFLA